MMLLLFNWSYYFFLFYFTGHSVNFAIVNLLKRFNRNEIFIGFLVFYKFWFGLAAIAFFAQIISLFYRINWEFHLLVLLIILPLSIYQRKEIFKDLSKLMHSIKSINLILQIFALILIFIIAFQATDGPAYNLDAGRYHFQNILWAKSYAVVPGLANLYNGFGHSSSWYLIHAFADIFFMNEKAYHVFNSLIYVIIILKGILSFNKVISGKFDFSNVFLSLFLFFLLYNHMYIFYWNLSCFSPDLSVNILIAICILFLIDFIDFQKKTWIQLLYYYVLFSILLTFAISIRLSSVFMILAFLPFLYLLIKYKSSAKIVIVFITIPAVLLAPTLSRNVILTGWILYPFPYINIFNFDWNVPYESVLGQYKCITYQCYLSNEIADFDSNNKILMQPAYLLFRNWFVKQLFSFSYLYYLICSVAVLLVSYLIRPVKTILLKKGIVVYIIISVVICSIWLYSSPMFRYGFGYLGVCFSISFAAVIYFLKKNHQYLTNAFLLIVAIVLFFNILVKSTTISLRRSGIEYPVKYAKYLIDKMPLCDLLDIPDSKFNTVCKKKSLINIVLWDTLYFNKYSRYRDNAFKRKNINIPNTNSEGYANSTEKSYNAFVATMLWNTPLPSTGAICNGFEYRGDRLTDGFRIRKNTE